MDLREFVSETLTQIVEGVKSAQSKAAESGATVNPAIRASAELAGKQDFLPTGAGYAQSVQFDVALTVTEGTGTKGGIGVFAGAINLGSSGQSHDESSSVSRVKFSVLLALPLKP